MTDVLMSVDVSASAGTTWLALTDWERQGEWMLGTQVHITQGDGRSIESRLAAFTGVFGLGFVDAMEITHWEPPMRCTVRHLGQVVKGTGSFHVQEKGPQKSVVVWSEQLELPWGVLGKLGWPAAKPLFLLGLRQSLKKFANYAATYGT